jgi:hypothetical protein
MVIVSPLIMSALLRTDALSGRRYVLVLLSGNIDVFQLVWPIVAMTGSEPQPRFNALKRALISLDLFLGMVMKCQAPRIALAFDEWLVSP